MKEALENKEVKDVRFLEAGIHDDVNYGSAVKGETKNGNKFLELSFDKDGRSMTHSEYEPKKWPGDSDDKFKDSCKSQALRILQILAPAYDNAVLSSFSGSSFDALADWVSSLFNAISKEKTVRLKAVYDKNGFVTLPRYSQYTFIESMSVDKANSAITELKIDKFTKPEVGDREEAVPSPAQAFSTSVF